jgi:hypothetical protein
MIIQNSLDGPEVHNPLLTLWEKSLFNLSFLFLFGLFVFGTSIQLFSQTNLCIGGTSQQTYSGSGGSWVSGNTAVATVSAGGLVTATGVGSTTVDYASFSNTSLYWDFDNTPSVTPGICTYNATSSSNSSLLSGIYTSTGSSTAIRPWGFWNNCVVQSNFGPQYSYIQFVTSGSRTNLSSMSFQAWHNHNACCAGTGPYTVQLQISSLSGGTWSAWSNVGSIFTFSSSASSQPSPNTSHNVSLVGNSVPAGTHRIRWFKTSGTTNSDGYIMNTVTFNCQSVSSVLYTNTINVNTVPAQPSAITAPAAICPNVAGTYSVTNDPSVTYSWTYSGTGTISGTGNSISLTASTGGTLSVRPTSICGNGTARTYTVNITALNAGAHNSTALNVCDGSNPAALTFTSAVSGGVSPYSYIWQNNTTDISGATTNSYDPPALTPGAYSYRCKVTDACGSVAYTAAKAINVAADPDAPSATKVPNLSSVCIGSTLTISNPVYGTNAGRSCGFEYAFSTNNGSTWSTTSTTIPSFTSTGTVNKIRVRAAGGCADACNTSNWTEYSWTVNANPTAAVAGTNSICPGTSTSFTASGGSTYLWSTGATTTTITASTAQTYNVTATDANGCTATANVTLTLIAQPPVASNTSSNLSIDLLVVGGGGGAGSLRGGGGGGGGYISVPSYNVSAGSSIPITVGVGGQAGYDNSGIGVHATSGTNSSFGSIYVAVGGGGGGSYGGGPQNGYNGGSGGGGANQSSSANTGFGGSGTTGQGFTGGNSRCGGGGEVSGGGGGGAGGAGSNGSSGSCGTCSNRPYNPGNGGNGIQNSITGSAVWYSGGGGGGGLGGNCSSGFNISGNNGQGGGQASYGGGGQCKVVSGSFSTERGGPGIVIIKYQGTPVATGGTITQVGGYTIHTFTANGTFALAGSASSAVVPNITRCGSGTVTFTGTVTSGLTLDWYSAATGGTLLSSGTTSFTTPVISSNTTYYAEVRNATTGCISASRLAVTATVNSSSIISANQSLCTGATPSTNIVLTSASGTIQWQSSTDNLSFSNIAGQTNATLSAATIGALTQTTYYRAIVTNGACISNSPVHTITANTNPSVPAVPNATQSFCVGTSRTVGDLTATGNNIQWYNISNGGTALSSGTSLTSGNYYATQTVNGCESPRLTVTVNMNAQPTSPAGIATNDVLWKGGAANPNDWSTASNWYVKTAGGYTVAPATPAATTNVFVGNTGSCINNSVVNLTGLTRCKNLYIESGATLNLGGSSDVLEVYGNWDNNGTLNANTSTVKFISPNNQSMNTAAASETFYNLYIDNNNSTNQNYLLTNKSVNVLNTFHMEGNVRMNTNTVLEIGSATNPGEVLWHDGVVIGPMKRWFLGNSSINVQSPTFHNVTTGSPHLNPAGIFPVGTLRTLPGGAVEHEHKNASVNFKTPVTTAGHLTVEFITSNANVLNANNSITTAGQTIGGLLVNTVTSTSGLNAIDFYGYWRIDASASLMTVNYDASFRALNIDLGSNPADVRVLKTSSFNAWNDGIAANNGSNTTMHTLNGANIHNDRVYSIENLLGFSGFTFGFNGSTLPIQLSSFAGETDNAVNYLKWTTQSEQNSSHFEMERSVDAINFEMIGRVNAMGVSNQVKQYSFNDVNPIKGMNYYRLKMVDIDGTNANSNTIALEIKGKETIFVFFPNPTSDVVSYQFTAETNESLNMEVVNTLGQVVISQNRNVRVGTNSISVNMSELAPGAYTVRVKHQKTGVTNSEKIIKK